MTTRVITGAALIIILVVALSLGGWWFAIPFYALMCISEYEMIRALNKAGHRIVEGPIWFFTLVSLPILTLRMGNISVLLSWAALTCMVISVVVIMRKDPQMMDVYASITPILCVMFPGMCMLGLMRAPNRETELMLMILSFGVPLFGDTCALFCGMKYGKRKLCEQVSPKKTVEGAVAGLGGSILFAFLVYAAFALRGVYVLPLWHIPVLGLLGGLAGQLGDLLASLIKRHCGIKDFGNIFPGHGGVMDRLDSVYMATIIMLIYMVTLL